MKVISVNGISKSGKTTICEALISGLRKRGYSVGSVKEIHFESFKIDPDPNTNTNRHKAAGAQLVAARGMAETDILYQEMLPIDQILAHYRHDYIILEGVTDCNVPRILAAHNREEVELAMDSRAVLVSGVIANLDIQKIVGLPVINALENSEKLVDFVIEYAAEPLPSFDPKCCTACGHTCAELAGLVAQKKANIQDCILSQADMQLIINGKEIDMVPFVQNILKNAVMGVISELAGFQENSEIEVKFKI